MDSAETAYSPAETMPDVLIPTLNPDDRLCGIVDELHERGIDEIIVVDDGSAPECETVFDELKKKPFCLLVRHDVNRGKGAALRTAFMKYLYEHPDGIGCVTCDDDGQHSVDDIINIAEKFREAPEALLLGQRDFSGRDVPWKSRFGNVLTRMVFRLLAGIRLGDTQTGLRAIPAEVMEESLSIRGNRFEFETEMLLRAWDDGVEFREIPIRTVYLNNNVGTHFHPVRDAVRIYRVILWHLFRQVFCFSLSGMASALVDFLLFLLLLKILPGESRNLRIMLAQITARACSATFNYSLNRYWVFYRSSKKASALSYLVLCLTIFMMSSFLVLLASRKFSDQWLPFAKGVIDTLLFFVSYFFQKLVVFRTSDHKRAYGVLAPVAVFAPMVPAMLLAGVLALPAFDGRTLFGNVLCGVFGDWLLPAAAFLAALRFRSRWCAFLAALLSCANLLLRILALALYRAAYMSIDFRDLELVWKHADGVALRAFLGENYLLWLTPALLAVLAAVAATGIVAWRNIRVLPPRARRKWGVVTAVLLAAALCSHIWLFCAEKLDTPLVYTGHLVRPLPVQTAHFIRDAFRGRRRVAAKPLSDESRRILESLEVIPRGEEPPPPAPARFDRIVIIALESLDLEFVRRANPAMPEGVTPNLDRLTAEYPSMTNFFCSAQPTSWGLTGMLMSRFDYERELDEAEKRPSLFSVASRLGYATCYFSPMSGVFADNRRCYGELFAPVRQYYLEEWSQKYGMRRSSKWGMRDDELYSCALREMRSWKNRRFVVLVSTMDTHWPYSSAGIGDAEKARFPTPFLRALHMADRHLGEFLREFMADETLYDGRTLIVVTSDHTATHGENYLRRPDFVPERVPLVFITPDRSVFAALDTEKYASGIDLAPTLARLVGGRAPESFLGRDLFSRKNLAISWLRSGKLLVRSPKWSAVIGAAPESDPERRAIADFFRGHH